jgi:hypothetical protein
MIEFDTDAKRFAQPAHQALFAFALPKMIAYQADIAVDLRILQDAKPGETFVYIVRERGTHCYLIDSVRAVTEVARHIGMVQGSFSDIVAAALITVETNDDNKLFPMIRLVPVKAIPAREPA